MASTKTDSRVEYVHLGKSGLKVSNLCLGTMTFGKNDDSPFAVLSSPTQADEEKAHEIMDRYVQLGGNFLDTANAYSFGQSEKIIGSWMKKRKNRENMVVATKVRVPMTADPNSGGLSRRHIIQSCEESLERLQTNYIDLYQTHAWDDATPLEETLRALDDLVRCGKVRYAGTSNVLGWQMQKIVDLSKSMGFAPHISLQQQYNLLVRHVEFEVFQVCKNEGIGVLPWSPLRGGLLTGKYKKGQEPNIGRIAHIQSKENQLDYIWSKHGKSESYWNLMDLIEKISKAKDKTPAQVSLRWLLQKDVVDSVIIGATSIKQLDDNMSVGTGWKLTKDEMEKLDEASKPDTGYPYDLMGIFNADRVNKYVPKSIVGNVY